MPHAELLQLFTEDQFDRDHWPPVPSPEAEALRARDEARLRRVAEIDRAGGIVDADDCYHAALVYQHGPEIAHTERAHALAARAVLLDPTHASARRLVCCAEDRILRRRGLPQRWGTQFFVDDDGVWTLDPVDGSVGDGERAQQGLPSLAEQLARVERENAQRRR